MSNTLIAEHIVELQTMQLFIKNVADNVYPGGGRRDGTQIKCDFMRTLQSNVLNNPPTTDGSTTNSNKPLTRILQVQGWEENWSVFVFLERAINAHKERVSNMNLIPSHYARSPKNRIHFCTEIARPALFTDLLGTRAGIYD